ncbi:MAG TPA: hypothetical protein VN783_16995 [Thermoanaerobaculia bacterium]|nr:hypothetical protein [Thermoanaerobaculia bacterium]
MNDLVTALRFALEKYPASTEVVSIRDILMDSARKNDKRPAWVSVALPDDMVKALRGTPRPDEDLLLLVRVPKDVLTRSESLIVLPNEVR